MASFKIMFGDLNEEVQKEFLAYMGMNDPSEGNYEVVPIAEIEYYPDEESEEGNENDLVTSCEVDCKCDCSDCEWTDKCTENGRYDFEEDDDNDHLPRFLMP